MATTALSLTMSLGVLLGVAVPAADAQWVDFVDETATRLPTPPNDPALSTFDLEEKDYAWGDVDQDGDVDLVVVRKEPFTTTGRRTNVLFMNEGTAEGHEIDGVLVDRTAQYAASSSILGDHGFLTPTNDRDVVLHDLDNDGWLDMVTAPTLTDMQPKHLSHPRVYMNRGEIAGAWQGFRHEASRIPLMHLTAGPRFCSVSAGDVTGDGYADLYFADYDNGVTGDPPELFDYDNKLLINLGPANPGVFIDETESRLTLQMRQSNFGTSSFIADINGDGYNDVVKQSALVDPYHVAVTYNSPTNQGQFDEGGTYDTVFTLAPYFANVGDLNQDGRLDIVVTDDGPDRYMLNQGNGIDDLADWTQFLFPDSDGFGGNSTIADLDGDGHVDVIITDVDVDVIGCERRTFIFHNQGDVPNVSFLEHHQVIPDAQLFGVHDAAVFDIDGDGFNDVVMGRCSGTQVWMNQPPYGLYFSYPAGVPETVTPDTSTELDVRVTGAGGSVADPDSGRVFVSVAGGPFVEQPLAHLGGDLYRAVLPATPCAERIRFHLRVDDADGGAFVDPEAAPQDVYTALASEGAGITFHDDLETDQHEWLVDDDPSLTGGAWERADPNGTIAGGSLAAPDDDATPGGTQAFVTDNGPPGGESWMNDVDNGPTRLISPVFDIAGPNAFVSFARWFFCDDEGGPGADFLFVDVSNDGGATWWPVPELTTGGTGSAWETVSFVLGDVVPPTSTVRLRFTTSDLPNDSVTEAGIDDFTIRECADPACPGDVDGSGAIDFGDLLALLSSWGPCPGCAEDLDQSGDVGFADLLQILSSWGPCSF